MDTCWDPNFCHGPNAEYFWFTQRTKLVGYLFIAATFRSTLRGATQETGKCQVPVRQMGV